MQFELIVRAAGQEDIVQRSVPLRPYGVPVFTAASGSSTSDGTVWLEAPEGMPAESARDADRRRPDRRAGPAGHRARPRAVVPNGSRPPGLGAGLGRQRRDGLAGPAEAARRQPRGGRAGSPGPRQPHPRFRQPAAFRAERRRRLELDRHARRRRQSLCKLPHRVGLDAGQEGRLRRAGRSLQQGPGLPAEPSGRDRQRRLREQGHLAARPGRGGARRFRPGQPPVSRSQRAQLRPPWSTLP